MSSFRKAALVAIFAAGCDGGRGTPASTLSADAGGAPAPVVALDPSIPMPTITIEDHSGYIEIADTRTDIQIRYTLDGSQPTATSTLYATPFFPTCTSPTAVVTAAAFTSSGMSASADTQFTQHPVGRAVVFSPGETHFAVSGQITLTCDGATAIYYTTDGTDPTTASTLYTGPITIDHSFEMAVVGVMGPDGCGNPGGEYTSIGHQFYTVGP